jgi:ABC-2 type transport system ATP-binding protein
MENVVEIAGLTKKYGGNVAVNNISFNVRHGEVLGFLGPNGAGKSTTMNILTGYLSSDKGSCKVGGIDILENPRAVKRMIGYLPEQPPLYSEMTPNEYLDFICDLKSVNENRRAHIEEIAKTVGIERVAGRLIKNLSKGYKQRTGLAGALIGNPEVLVLDEPTVGLDPRQIIEIRNLIKGLGKSRTIILSTHILQEVTAVCDSVAIINHGEIVARDALYNLTRGNKGGRWVLRLISDEDALRDLLPHTEFIEKFSIYGQKEPGTVDVMIESRDNEDIRERLFHLFKDNNMSILSFKSSEKNLEDIFIQATNKASASTEEEQTEARKNIFKNLFIKKTDAPDASKDAPKAKIEEKAAETENTEDVGNIDDIETEENN